MAVVECRLVACLEAALLTGHTAIQENRIQSYGSGGGVYLEKSQLSLSGKLTLIGNKANQGGGITTVNSNLISIALIIKENSCIDDGGGGFIGEHTKSQAPWKHCL